MNQNPTQANSKYQRVIKISGCTTYKSEERMGTRSSFWSVASVILRRKTGRGKLPRTKLIKSGEGVKQFIKDFEAAKKDHS